MTPEYKMWKDRRDAEIAEEDRLYLEAHKRAIKAWMDELPNAEDDFVPGVVEKIAFAYVAFLAATIVVSFTVIVAGWPA